MMVSAYTSVYTSNESYLAKGMIVASAFTLALCFKIIPPYGRHSRETIFGVRFPLLNAKLAWILMESPNLVMAAWCWRHSTEACRRSPANLILLGLFVGHYINRALVFPLRTRGGKPMPAFATACAFQFCTINGYMQSSHLLYSAVYPDSWLTDPRFLAGVMMFALGFGINYHSDGILRGLRRSGETGYKIPRGALFEYISGANFFGECVEWCGFAIAGWSLEGSSFALYTISNLVPRAYWHHRWYLDEFKDKYPSRRKALIPFLW